MPDSLILVAYWSPVAHSHQSLLSSSASSGLRDEADADEVVGWGVKVGGEGDFGAAGVDEGGSDDRWWCPPDAASDALIRVDGGGEGGTGRIPTFLRYYWGALCYVGI